VFKNIGCFTDPAKTKMYQERMTLLAQAGFVFDEKELVGTDRGHSGETKSW
jgi:hypothetical protein